MQPDATTQMGLRLDEALGELLAAPPHPLTSAQQSAIDSARADVQRALDPAQPGSANADALTGILRRLTEIAGPLLMAYLLRKLVTPAMTTAPGTPRAEPESGGGLEELIRTLTGGGRGERAQPSGGDPLGDLIGTLIGGGERGERRQPDERRRDEPADPLGDLIGTLIGGGEREGRRQPDSTPAGDPLAELIETLIGAGGAPREAEAPRRAEPAPQGDPLSDFIRTLIGAAEAEVRQTPPPAARAEPPAVRPADETLYDQLDDLLGDDRRR